MLSDLGTILWKEWHELTVSRGNLRGGWLGLVIFGGVFGVYMPLQSGPAWVTSPVGLVFFAWVPLFLVSGVVADSFAGERERHTLETLLASRLSDRAILFGKVGAAVGYGWFATVLLLLVGLVTVNVAFGRGGLLMFAPQVGLGMLGLTFLTSLLVASAGVLVSLRASTVRQATQTLALGSALLVFAPIIGYQVLSGESRNTLLKGLSGGDVPSSIIVGVVLVLALLDLLLLLAAIARFQRARLILS